MILASLASKTVKKPIAPLKNSSKNILLLSLFYLFVSSVNSNMNELRSLFSQLKFVTVIGLKANLACLVVKC